MLWRFYGPRGDFPSDFTSRTTCTSLPFDFRWTAATLFTAVFVLWPLHSYIFSHFNCSVFLSKLWFTELFFSLPEDRKYFFALVFLDVWWVGSDCSLRSSYSRYPEVSFPVKQQQKWKLLGLHFLRRTNLVKDAQSRKFEVILSHLHRVLYNTYEVDTAISCIWP